MGTIDFPATKIKPLPTPLPGDVIALAERDIHGACADLMLVVTEMTSLTDVLALSKKLIALRAALDTVSDFVLAQAEELTR
jgi:hypothetical protein